MNAALNHPWFEEMKSELAPAKVKRPLAPTEDFEKDDSELKAQADQKPRATRPAKRTKLEA